MNAGNYADTHKRGVTCNLRNVTITTPRDTAVVEIVAKGRFGAVVDQQADGLETTVSMMNACEVGREWRGNHVYFITGEQHLFEGRDCL